MREERAKALGIRTLSDLVRHSGLQIGLSQEFLNRKDGWPALKAKYALMVCRSRRAVSITASPTKRSRPGKLDAIDVIRPTRKSCGRDPRAR